MIQPIQTVVGINVGGERKGFHAVSLRGGTFVDMTASTDPAEIVDWCLAHEAAVVAIDAPFGWSQTGSSRLAERGLELFGSKIACFATHRRERARTHDKGFYDWVLNGESLYQLAAKHYAIFDGKRERQSACIETFPHAITCAIIGQIVSAKSKATIRRQAL